MAAAVCDADAAAVAAAFEVRVCGIGVDVECGGVPVVQLWTGNDDDAIITVNFSDLSRANVAMFAEDLARATAGRVVMSSPATPFIIVSAFVEPMGLLAPKKTPGLDELCALSHRLATLFAKAPIEDVCVADNCEHTLAGTACREQLIQEAARHEIANTLKCDASTAAEPLPASLQMPIGEVARIGFLPWRGYGSGITLFRADGTTLGLAGTNAGQYGDQLWEFLLAVESRIEQFNISFFVEYEQRLLMGRLSLALHLASTSLFATRSDSRRAAWERRPHYVANCIGTDGKRYVAAQVPGKNAAQRFPEFPGSCLRAAGLL